MTGPVSSGEKQLLRKNEFERDSHSIQRPQIFVRLEMKLLYKYDLDSSKYSCFSKSSNGDML